MRKLMLMLLVLSSAALGYGYWDVTGGIGARVEGLNPVSMGLGGAALPEGSSALLVFTNPAGLAGVLRPGVALAGWGTRWREEINYHYECVEPYRYNLGTMSPRGSFAVYTPLGRGFTAGAGIATVAQYQARATVMEYKDGSNGLPELQRMMILDGSGDVHEALASLSGFLGPVRLGVSPGIRFGSGSNTILSSVSHGGGQYDSVITENWEKESFALRAGAVMDIGISRVYSSYVSGDDTYYSEVALGGTAYLSFLAGGHLGAEVSIRDGRHTKVTAYTRFPWAYSNTSYYLGVSGYRPEAALKNGIGLSWGMDIDLGRGAAVNLVYYYHSRYRDGNSVDTPYINHLFDSGEGFMLGYRQSF